MFHKFQGNASSHADLQGTVSIQNVTQEVVEFKVKTTSPEKFRVAPPAGLIHPGQVEKITITMVHGFELGSARDKFLIMSKSLPEGQTAETLTVDKIHRDFKMSENSADIEYHRVRCIYPVGGGESPGSGGAGGGAGGDNERVLVKNMSSVGGAALHNGQFSRNNNSQVSGYVGGRSEQKRTQRF